MLLEDDRTQIINGLFQQCSTGCLQPPYATTNVDRRVSRLVQMDVDERVV